MQNNIADVDKVDPESGLAPIHHIVLERRENKISLLLTLLVYGKANIDAVARDGKTTLMLAIMVRAPPLFINMLYVYIKFLRCARHMVSLHCVLHRLKISQ